MSILRLKHFLAAALFHPLKLFVSKPFSTVCGYMPSGTTRY